MLDLVHPDGLLDIAWSPDGRRIAVAPAPTPSFSTHGPVGCWSWPRATRGTSWPGLVEPAGSPGSDRLATASEDGTARVYVVDERAATEVVRLSALDMRNGVRSVAFSPDGNELMTSDWAVTSVKVWDVPTRRRRKS